MPSPPPLPPTTTHRALMNKMFASPEDDDVRLVFADWFEDQGDADRANVVRLQCEIARLDPWERRWQEATWRSDALIELHGDRWRSAELPVLDGIAWGTFERGFVTTVRARDVTALYEHDKIIAEVTPACTVEMQSLIEEEIARPDGSVPWLKTLRFTNPGFTNNEVARVSPSLLSAPKRIEVTGLTDGQNLAWLLDWMSRDMAPPSSSGGDNKADVSSPALTELILDGTHTVGLPFVRELAEAGEAAAAGAAAATVPFHLERLEIGTRFVDYDSGYFQDPTIGADGVTILAEAGFLKKLEVLDVSRQRIGGEGLMTLVRAFPRLRSIKARAVDCTNLRFFKESSGELIDRLDVAGNAIADCNPFRQARRLAELKMLDLDTCEIGPHMLEDLTKAPCWQTLRHLVLNRNPLGEAGVEVLSKASAPTNLHTLALMDTDIDGRSMKTVAILARIPWIRDLLSLDLSRNELGSFAALKALGKGSIRRLSLARTSLGAAGIAELIPLWKQLWHLDLSDNEALGDEGVETLSDNIADLQTLRLNRCGITSNGLMHLADRASVCNSSPSGGPQRRPPTHLYELALAGNAFDADAIAHLVESPLFDHLRLLDLSTCKLGDDAAKVLASSPRASQLRTLNLRRNTLTENGLLALARSEHLAHVTIQLTADAWRLPKPSQAFLEERFGPAWYWYREQPEELEEGDNPYAVDE